jgi:8-oxo-dGDP phosphatase
VSAVEDPAPAGWQVGSSDVLLANWLLTVRSDSVRMSDEHYAKRMVVTHPGAVAVLALDDRDQVLMIKQYRHPVGRELWELPAGLRDVDGEPALATAQRELLEETGWRAGDWHTLVDYYTSPGFTDERIRVYLARDLTRACGAAGHGAAKHGAGGHGAGGHGAAKHGAAGHGAAEHGAGGHGAAEHGAGGHGAGGTTPDEEAYIVTEWVPLREAIRLALAGKLHSGPAIAGVMSGYAAWAEGFAGLRPGEAPE